MNPASAPAPSDDATRPAPPLPPPASAGASAGDSATVTAFATPGGAATASGPAGSVGAPGPERQLRDLQVVLDIARRMGAATRLDDLLGLILDSVREVLSADRASLFLYDAARHELFSKIAHGSETIRFPADKGIAGAAASTRHTVNIPDCYADPRFNREVDRKTGYRTRCLLTVPLFGLDDQLIGVVQALNKRDGVFTTYDERLAEALAAQIGVAIQRARLLDHYVEKKQMEHSLSIAREIQQNLLPKEPPKVAGYDIAGWSKPADETGGDCYDFTPMAAADGVPARWGITVADATGHGIGPALVVSTTRALLRAISGTVGRADEVLAKANAWLCADLTEGRFVTVFFGVLDPVAHRLDYASAGHGPLFWYRAADRAVADTGATGLPLGLMDLSEYERASPIDMAPGDVGVILTDGFIEAHDPAGELFGEDRTKALIAANADRPAAEIIAALESAVRAHMAGGPQLDDLTAVVIKRTA
jgi:phosphoserine phosphatase